MRRLIVTRIGKVYIYLSISIHGFEKFSQYVFEYGLHII